jgi:TolA-binding protein
MTRHRALPFAAGTLLALATLATPHAFAVNKDMVQLQTQVQNLQDSVARLQQSNDERMGVLKDLVQQTADAVNKMSTTVQGLEQQMRQQQEAAGGKTEQFSGQISSLNDSVDEVKARLNNVDKALQAIQSQQQSINATLQNMGPQQPANGTAAPGMPGPDQNVPPAGTGPNQPAAAPGGQPMADNKPSPDVPFATRQGPYAGSRNAQPAQPSGPPVGELYNAALRDYIAAKYSVASDEFNQVIQANASDNLAGNAYYYLGEIEYHAGKYSAAVKDYDHVLSDYPGNQKIAVSHLHKGMALLQLKDREAGISEFRAVIQRFPTTPEATQARSKLNGMGVPANARR